MEVMSGNTDNPKNIDTSSNANDEVPEIQQAQQKTKRKHRRGKPKPKNSSKPFKNSGNWRFQVPRLKYNERQRPRPKLIRSNSLAPYNTNKFLMEEHMIEVPTLQTPTGRTRDSSFSVDSEDNYFFSLPEDEEDFLTKEFSNVYEKARVERLENMNKQQLIEECLQIEDRYANDQQQFEIQRISSEFMTRIKCLEEKVKELTRENYNLRCQLMRSTAVAATAASPPSASAPTSTACQPGRMESSEDTESDSDTSSSSSSSSCSSHSPVVNEADAFVANNAMAVDTDDGDNECSPEVSDSKPDEPVVVNKIDDGCNRVVPQDELIGLKCEAVEREKELIE